MSEFADTGKRENTVALQVDVFWSFRSPYSYLATPRMVALEKIWDLNFCVRPVYPIAVRLDGWFKNANPMWLPYLVRDVMREAERHDIPFMWPRPDPILMDMATGTVSKEQPHIHRRGGKGARPAFHLRSLIDALQRPHAKLARRQSLARRRRACGARPHRTR
jgi:2-hydroxychromene-2-carboxylate isomerase